MNAKISIITPTYNAEKYIGRCLDYSLEQSYQNIEIIVVDDGSSDSTLKIEKQYARKDSRIKLVQQKHKGPNAARKKGIDVATGEYVMFVDADDYLDKNAVSTVMGALSNEKIDSVRFSADFDGDGRVVHSVLKKGETRRVFNESEILSLLLTTYKLNSLWTHVYKKDALKEAKSFDYDLRFGEDFLVNLEICEQNKKTLVISDILYHYCDNPNSTTRKHSSEQVLKNISDRIFASGRAIEYAKKKIRNKSELNNAVFSQLRMVVDSIQKLATIDGYKKKDFLLGIERVLSRDSFSMVETGEIMSHISSLGIAIKLKNRRIIHAVLESEYEYIWKYIRIIRLYNKFRGKK